jgi:hypothetical protein
MAGQLFGKTDATGGADPAAAGQNRSFAHTDEPLGADIQVAVISAS